MDNKPSVLKAFVQRWLISTLAVLVATHMVDGIKYDSASTLFVASLLLGILTAFLRPLLLLLSLPLLIFTLGLFTLVINAALLYWVGKLVKGFQVDSFSAAFWGALVISLASLVLNSLTGTGSARVEVRRGPPPPPPPPDRDDRGGGGPVIDV